MLEENVWKEIITQKMQIDFLKEGETSQKIEMKFWQKNGKKKMNSCQKIEKSLENERKRETYFLAQLSEHGQL